MSPSSRTTAAARDAQVLDAIRRLGIGVRELIAHALGGIDPNNIIQRLVTKRAIQAVPGLPQNRSYYLPQGEKPLGAQALQQRLALCWHVLMNPGPPCLALMPEELTELFGLQAPSGVHVLQADTKPRVLHVYAPETIEVAAGIVRHVEKARSLPKVDNAIQEGDYGFLVLVPWTSNLEPKLKAALASEDLAGVEATFIPQARKLKTVSRGVHFEVARAPTPETLGLALKEARVK